MTMLLLFRAMTKERDCLLPRQMLEEAQRKLLAVVLDSFVASIHTAGFHELREVAAAVFFPRNFSAKNRVAKLLAWTQVCHPHIEAIGRQTASSPAGRQNPQTIARFDFSMDRLRMEHGSEWGEITTHAERVNTFVFSKKTASGALGPAPK
jgi:hypothetical protein